MTALLVEGENTIQVAFHDPRPVFAEHHKRRPLRGADDSIDGYQNVRKAHFMSGYCYMYFGGNLLHYIRYCNSFSKSYFIPCGMCYLWLWLRCFMACNL